MEHTKAKALEWSKMDSSQRKNWLKIDKSVAKPKKSVMNGGKGTRTKFMEELDAHKADRRFW